MASAQSLIKPFWRGSFKVCSEDLDTVEGLAAHLSNKAEALDVSTVESSLPSSLFLNFLPSDDVWQMCFGNSVPIDEIIGLHFFPENGRCEKDYFRLLDKMYFEDLSTKTEFESWEIFLFSSLLLPTHCQRIKNKHYLWGVIMEKKAPQPGRLCEQAGCCQDFGSPKSATDGCEEDGEHVKLQTKASQLETDIDSEGHLSGDTNSNHELSDQSNDDSHFLDIVHAFNEAEQLAEADSVCPVVQVASYTVEASLGPTLQAIFDKYGDIARGCPIESTSARSRFLEKLCRNIKELEGVESIGCQKHHLKSLHTVVTDAESVGFDVGWLRQRHDELKATFDGLMNYSTLKNDLEKSKVEAESRKNALESRKADTVRVRSEIQTLKEQLASSEAVKEILESKMRDQRLKAKKCVRKSLADGLL